VTGVLLGLLASTPAPGSGRATPPPVEATGGGGIGFLLICVLIAASVGIYLALRGSMRRLRAQQEAGTFGVRRDDRPA